MIMNDDTRPDDGDGGMDADDTRLYEAETSSDVYENAVDDHLVTEPDAKRKRISSSLVFLGVGTLVGLSLAAAIAYFLKPPAFDDSAIRSDIAALSSKVQRLERAPEPAPVNLTPVRNDLRAVQTRLSTLRDRITTLEETADPAPIYADLVTRLETLQAEGFDIPEDFVFPDAPAPVDLSGIENRLTQLEQAVEKLASRSPQVITLAPPQESVDERFQTLAIDVSALPPFPADRLREAANELSGQGLVRRLLSQHVRVNGERNAKVLIKDIERYLANDQPRAALASYDALPDAMQSIARGWRADLAAAIDRAETRAQETPVQ